jgi:hypothetical protein
MSQHTKYFYTLLAATHLKSSGLGHIYNMVARGGKEFAEDWAKAWGLKI